MAVFDNMRKLFENRCIKDDFIFYGTWIYLRSELSAAPLKELGEWEALSLPDELLLDLLDRGAGLLHIAHRPALGQFS